MRWAWLFAALSAHAAEQGYVDPAACRPCHPQIFDSYRKTGMGRSFARAGDVPRLAEFFHQPSERYYSVVERGDGHYLRRSQAGGDQYHREADRLRDRLRESLENISPSRPGRPAHRASGKLVFRARRILGR